MAFNRSNCLFLKICLPFLSLLFAQGCSNGKLVELDSSTKALKADNSDIRGLQAQHTTAINELRAQIRELSGRVEELQHQSTGKTQELEQTISALKSRVPPPSGVPEELLVSDEEKISAISGPSADMYKRAIEKVRTGDFETARQELSSFAEQNPGTAFTDNALFWLGISNDKLGQYDRAIVAFSEVFQKYPAEDMVAPALLYLAESFLKMGSKSDAVLTLQKLVDEHSSSSYASKGKAKLVELQAGARRRK